LLLVVLSKFHREVALRGDGQFLRVELNVYRGAGVGENLAGDEAFGVG